MSVFGYRAGGYEQVVRLSLAAVFALTWLTVLIGGASALTEPPSLTPLLPAEEQNRVPSNLIAQFSGSSQPASGTLSLTLPQRGSLRVQMFSTHAAASATQALMLAGGTGLAAFETTSLISPEARDSREASLYRLAFSNDRMELKGSLLDVGARFGQRASDTQSLTGEDAELLRQSAGNSGLNLSGTWKLGGALSLSSSYDTTDRNKPGSEQNGLRTTDSSQVLRFALGQQGAITASLVEHRDEWAAGTGRGSGGRREQKLEFNHTLGPGGSGALRLALNTAHVTEGTSDRTETAREAHLALAPTSRLKLNADYSAKGQEGAQQTAQAVSAAFALSPATQMSASFASREEGDQQNADAALSLATTLAGGKLSAEQKTHTGAEGNLVARKGSYEGGFGAGPGRVSIKLNLQSLQGEGPDAKLDHTLFLHLDRSFGKAVKLMLERRAVAKGTNTDAPETLETKYEVTAALRPGTSLTTTVVSGTAAGMAMSYQRVLLTQQAKRFRLQADSGRWQHGESSHAQTTFALELPSEDLPEWAKSVVSAHEFEDAQEYRRGASAPWTRPEMTFTGYRLWTTRRSGVEDGVDSLGFAHQRLLSSRCHLQYLYEERPEGTEDANRGRPQPFTRHSLDVGGPALGRVNARVGLGYQTALEESGGSLLRLRTGVWGKLRQGSQLEAEAWQESGTWSGTACDRTGVSMMYSRRLSEEHRVLVKFGYAWGNGVGENGREGRADLAYDKPI